VQALHISSSITDEVLDAGNAAAAAAAAAAVYSA